MRPRAWLVGVALSLLMITGCAPTKHADRLAQARASGTIRIAITGMSPPWSYFDEAHRPAGYDVAVARAIAARLGIANPVFIPDTYKNFVEGLKTSKYDLVMNDLTPTPERARQVDFGRAYGVEDFRIFTRSDDRSINAIADLRGRVLGITTGTSNETWARARIPDAEIRGYDNGAYIFRDLALGRIDAVIISHFGGLRYARELGQPVREVGGPLSFQLSAPAMAKGQPELRAAVNGAVAAMIASGELDRLAERWVAVDYRMSDAITLGEREAATERRTVVPDTNGGMALVRRALPLLGPALATTVFLGITAFVLGSGLGLGIALARISRFAALRWVALAYVSVFRGTPLLVQLLLVYFGLPQIGIELGPLTAAVVALTAFCAAYLSEDFRAGIVAVDRGQWDAATSLGMGYWLTLRRVILPQGLRIALPSTGGRLIALMKDTSLASVITVVEMTRVADEVGATTFRYVEAFLMVGLVYWALNQCLTIVQIATERRLSRHLR